MQINANSEENVHNATPPVSLCEPHDDVDFFPFWAQFLLQTSCTHQHTNIWHSLSRNFIFWPLCEKSTISHSTLNFEATADFFPSACGLLYATREHLTSLADRPQFALSQFCPTALLIARNAKTDAVVAFTTRCRTPTAKPG